MRFLALFEDSVREALDTKVFTVQVGLALVLVLLVASASFEPEPADRVLMQMVDQLNRPPESGRGHVRPMPPPGQQGRPEQYQFLSATAIAGSGAPYRQSYRVKISVIPPNPEDLTELRTEPEPAARRLREKFGLSGETHAFEVSDVRPCEEPAAAGRGGVPFQMDLTPNGDTLRLWPHHMSLFFGAWSPGGPQNPPALGPQVYVIENFLANGLAAWVTVLLGIVITAFFVPHMLRRGSVDLLLVRPMRRPSLLLWKCGTAVLFIGLSFAALMTCLWLSVGLRTGVWATGLLVSIPAMTFFFAVLYAVSAYFGVVTRSPIVCILVTLIVWFALWAVGTIHADMQVSGPTDYPEWARRTVDTLHAVLPRTKDLGLLMTRTLSSELLTEPDWREFGVVQLPALNWSESLGVSAAFIAVLLGLACRHFTRRDY
jgi:ABC-type transport system involved in multi-copper enzyme maturation permease subunit